MIICTVISTKYVYLHQLCFRNLFFVSFKSPVNKRTLSLVIVFVFSFYSFLYPFRTQVKV